MFITNWKYECLKRSNERLKNNVMKLEDRLRKLGEALGYCYSETSPDNYLYPAWRKKDETP